MVLKNKKITLSRSLRNQSPPMSTLPPPLQASEIKQTFVSTHLASLLAFEQSTSGYTRDEIKVTCLNSPVQLQSVFQLHLLLFEKQVTEL